MFLKDKQYGTTKVLACVDGWKQWEGSQKKDATSPTVALELVIIASAIDANERRYLAVVDIPGEFLTADMDKYFIKLLWLILSEIMVKTEPRIHRKFVTIENR